MYYETHNQFQFSRTHSVTGRSQEGNSEQSNGWSNRKFEKRFRYIEDELNKTGKNVNESSLEEMDKLWDEAKLIN